MATEKSNQVMDNIGVSVGDITKNIEQVVSSIEHISNYNLLPVFMNFSIGISIFGYQSGQIPSLHLDIFLFLIYWRNWLSYILL